MNTPVRPSEPCEICGGSGVIKEGLWDAHGHPCSHCEGTGNEPAKKVISSPFEDEGLGIGSEPNPE